MKNRILAIGAHPDDIEIGCGGTIRLFANNGYEIKFIVVTSGEEGTLENKDYFRSERESESVQSAYFLGVSEILFLREPDGLTSYSKKTKINLVKILRDFKPEIVFIHSSDDCFPDHKVVSELSKSAIQAAGGPWYADAGKIPHRVSDVYGYEVWNPIRQPQMTVDISESFEEKIRALEYHKTQTANFNYIGAVRGLNEYRGAMTMTGKFAEAFEVIQVGANLRKHS